MAPVTISGSLYFAHQHINKTRYPRAFNQPIGGPKFSAMNKATNRQVEDSDDPDEAMEEISAGSKRPIPKTREINKERTSYQNVHVLGGRAAVARKVSANLNSDDEIIVRMKQEKRTDREIAQALKNAGRVDYHIKTIGSRWKRLRIALAAAKDKELDAGYEDWHAIDDRNLLRAAETADCIVYQMKQKIEDMRWEIVAGKLRELQPTLQYSKNACHRRFESLQNGTATIPPELDDNPQQRKTKSAEAKKKHEAQIAKEKAEEAIAEANNKNEAVEAGPLHGRHPTVSHQQNKSGNGTGCADQIKASKRIPTRKVAGSTDKEPNGRSGDGLEAVSDEQTEGEIGESSSSTTTSPIMSRSQLHMTTNSAKSCCDATSVQPAKPSGPISAPISALPHFARLATDAENDVVLGMFPGLKRVEDMTRDQLRAELKARGLIRDGIKDVLGKRVKDARAGRKNLPRSPVPGNVELLGGRHGPKVSQSDGAVTSALGVRRRQPSPSGSVTGSVSAKKPKLQEHQSPVVDELQRSYGTAQTPVSSNAQAFKVPSMAVPLSKSPTSQEQALQSSVKSRCRLVLRNFPKVFSTESIRSLFSACSVINVTSRTEPGSFFVDCKDVMAADKAVANFHGSIIGGDKVFVENVFELVQSFFLKQSRAVSDSDERLPPEPDPRAADDASVAPDNVRLFTAASGSSADAEETSNIIKDLKDPV